MNQSHAPDVAKQADQHRQNGPKATDFSVSCPMKCDKWPNQHVYGCSKRDVSNYDRISELLTSSTHGTIGVSTTSKELQMLIEYIRAAMRQARYEILPDDDTFYGEIPDFPGMYANTDNLETCRQELEEVLEEWVLLRVSRNLPLPIVDGIEFAIKGVA